MSNKSYDFSGWATRNDLRCADGRTIRHGAFADNDGARVPLVWMHQHNESTNVLGHADLENRNEGVYAYCTFNDTPSGENAKALVAHGDVNALSIYANQLKEKNGDVYHGNIREVSLVLAGANPGAMIDQIAFAHGEEDFGEAVIYNDDVIEHSADTEGDDVEDEEKQGSNGSKKTIGDVFNTLNDEQKTVVYAIIGEALEQMKTGKGADDDDDEGDDEDMKHNLFDAEDEFDNDVLMHDAMDTIISDGKRFGSLKESFIQHADEYGISNIDWLFPDARNINDGAPQFITRQPDDWVKTVMSGVHHTPFSRIKMMFADLREDDARAKGYAQKAKIKKEEVFGLVKRSIEPTTIYKKQKLDRDDIVDITDFDVISWLKGEMRSMLDEEIARAILFGDGRLSSAEDKIDETKIIPIVKEASLYLITQTLSASYTTKDLITAAVRGQNDYEGSGNTTMFVANSVVTDMLLLEDTQGHRMYKDVHELALACSVNKICKVPDTIIPSGIKMVIVDLKDYNVGADKGGSVNMFDDFDIDYNQQKYLIETRCSGALTKPFSAIVVKETSAG